MGTGGGRMSKIKAFMLKKNMLIRIVLSYLFVGLLVIGAISFLITNKISDSFTLEMERSTDQAIEQSYNTASLMLNSTYRNFESVYSDEIIQAGFFDDAFTTIDMGRIGNKLYEAANDSPLVHSLYLINAPQRIVFSSLSTARTFEQFYDPQILELMNNTTPYRSGIFIPRHVQMKVDGKELDTNLISTVYLNTRDDRLANGAMILNLDQQVLQSMVMNGTGSHSFQSMILNRQGTVISHSDSARINSDVSGQEFVKRIYSAEAMKGFFELEMDHQRYRVFYIKSDSLGWTFVGLTNYEQLLGKVNAVKGYILSVTAILLLIVILSGAFFTRMIYGPIHRLLKSLNHPSKEAAGSRIISEFDLLAGTFSYLESKVQNLQTRVAGFQSAKRQRLLKMLTKGGWSQEDDMNAMLQDTGIVFDYSHFVVCLLSLDYFKNLSQTYNPSDISLLKYAVSNIAEEVGSGKLPLISFDDEGEAIVLIINVPSEIQAWEAMLQDMMIEIQANVKRYLSLSVSASIGTCVENVTEIHQSSASAYNRSRYRLVLGAGCLVNHEIEEARESLSDSLISGLEKQVIDGMKLGDVPKVRGNLQEYIAALRKAPYDELMLHLTQLLIAAARAAKTMADSNQPYTLDIGSLGRQLYQWETLEQIEEWFMEVCHLTISLRDKESLQKNRLIVEKIKGYIHNHYADPNLTVETLVEIGGLSLNYTRKLFKDITGQSITVYMSVYRFEEAKRLLIDTDLPANKIGEMVGFQNTNYFYVSFKKYCGKTPDHYRKSDKLSLYDDSEMTI
jgi:two-component system, response regulator YesN